jgi:choline dehydrogenase-like flavoprotein
LFSPITFQLGWFSIIRDRDSKGNVFIGGDGVAHIDFKLGDIDARASVHGLGKLVLLAEAAGAERVAVSIRGIEECVFGSGASRRAIAEAYAKRIEASFSLLSITSPIGCAHQMGSCRMASSATLGAVNLNGELYSNPGIFVADASLFPTASGVNPYFSVAALAYHVAKRLQEDVDRFK